MAVTSSMRNEAQRRSWKSADGLPPGCSGRTSGWRMWRVASTRRFLRSTVGDGPGSRVAMPLWRLSRVSFSPAGFRTSRRGNSSRFCCVARWRPDIYGLWTCARVAQVIDREFGVTYHADHVGRLLHSLGFTPQKPRRRARERDEEAIERWRRVDWPRIKKGERGEKLASSSSTRRDFCCSR